MMAQKRLHELLREDQEPFLLRNCEIKRPNPRTTTTTTTTPHLQLTKRLRKPPISQVSNFPPNFCKNACFFSFDAANSPDPTKSPLFTFQSPLKSPCRNSNNNNTILLHIPARTATLLLEAALRIQKQSSEPQKPKNSNGFGLFGSLLKRLTHRSKPRRKEISGDGVKVSVKDILRWDSSVGRKSSAINEETARKNEVEVILINDDKGVCENASSFSNCSCNGSRPSSSAAWSSESNEGKSMGTSSGSLSGEDVSFAFNQVINDTIDFASFDKHFCESPFHFVLQSTTPSSGDRTPDFNSPATSPRQHKIEEKEKNDVEKLIKFQLNRNGGGEEEEEDKEQCSPVSVLDPPFEDDDEGHDEDDDDDDDDNDDDDDDDDDGEDDGFDQHECSYAIVQRAKHQLLQKLRRFEKLAGLDPVELEKRMLEQEEEATDDDSNKTNDFEEEEEEFKDDGFAAEDISESSFFHPKKIPNDMKKLVSDLIDEEERKQSSMTNKEATMKKVWKKLESWKGVESNTIDMMVEQDFQRELDEWKRNPEQVKDAVVEIEIGIFGLLVEELSQELINI